MQGLKWISVLTTIIGVIFMIYGWTQSWGFGAPSSEYETVLMKRTVRTYVFSISGFILLILGISIELVRDNLKGCFYELENKN